MIKTVDQYLESLNDGREIWCLGEKVKDVRTHGSDDAVVAFHMERLSRKLGISVLTSKDFMLNWAAGLEFFENGSIYALKSRIDPVEVYLLKEEAEWKARG